MNNLGRVWATLAFVAAISVPAVLAAENSKRSYQIFGSGGVSCGAWTEEHERNQAMRQLDLAWVLGWLTSYNRYVDSGGDITQGADSAAIAGWMDNYYAAHPLDNLGTAAERLVLELQFKPRK